MKKFIGIVLSAIIIALPAASRAEVKIAVVNEATVMKESKAIKEFQEKIAKFEAEFRTSLEGQKQELKKAVEKLIEQKDKLSKVDLEKKSQALTQRDQEMSQSAQKLFKKVEAALLPAMEQVKAAVEKAIEKVAKDKKATIVYHKNSVAYFDEALDITKDVTNELQTSLKTVKVDLPKIN